jgi:uncharacterized protein
VKQQSERGRLAIAPAAASKRGAAAWSLLAVIRAHLLAQWRTLGPLALLASVLACLRALVGWKSNAQLLRLGVVAKYIVPRHAPAALSHLTRRHYLCREFTWSQRVDCALSHYAHESERYDDSYLAAVYGGAGKLLWAADAGGVSYRLVLRACPGLEHEGAVSAALFGGDQCLCEMSFSWVPARLFGHGRSGSILFVTRNQSLPAAAPALQRFRAAFPQNSPCYFCMAAVQGIAKANGARAIAAIKHDLQIAFEKKYAEGFRSSYCMFWRSFGAAALARHGYLIEVPPKLAPLAQLAQRHRKRAQARRANWAAIFESSADAIAAHQRNRACAAQGQARYPALSGMLSTLTSLTWIV